jgi:hypothetical protein
VNEDIDEDGAVTQSFVIKKWGVRTGVDWIFSAVVSTVLNVQGL